MNLTIDGALDLAGEPFVIERGGEKQAETDGQRRKKERRIDFRPNTDIQPGDWVVAKLSGNRFYIYETDVYVVQRRPFSKQAYYRTEAEYESSESTPLSSAPVVFNIFGDNYASNIASPRAQINQPTFTFGNLYEEIERRGDGDSEALTEMVRNIENSLERKEDLSHSWLIKYSELLDRHSWITGPIAQLLMLYLMTGSVA